MGGGKRDGMRERGNRREKKDKGEWRGDDAFVRY